MARSKTMPNKTIGTGIKDLNMNFDMTGPYADDADALAEDRPVNVVAADAKMWTNYVGAGTAKRRRVLDCLTGGEASTLRDLLLKCRDWLADQDSFTGTSDDPAP